MDNTFDDPTKAVLKPRVDGESIKVAETVLRRRDRNIEEKGRRAARIARQKKIRGTLKTRKIINPAKLVKLSKKRATDRKRIKNIWNKKKSKVSHFGKVLMVQRNRRPGGSSETKAMLRSLRIMTFGSTVFLPNTVETLDKLKVVRPFVTWGNPCFEVVDDILHKTAAIQHGQKTVKLTDNSLIEEHLADCGMFCVEDLVNEIFSAGPNFDKVTERLRPIQLGDYTTRQSEGFLREEKIEFGDIRFKINDRIREFLGDKKPKLTEEEEAARLAAKEEAKKLRAPTTAEKRKRKKEKRKLAKLNKENAKEVKKNEQKPESTEPVVEVVEKKKNKKNKK